MGASRSTSRAISSRPTRRWTSRWTKWSDEMEYGFDCFISSDAKRLDGKIVTITTHPDPDWGKPEVRHERVRCMFGGGFSLLVLADGDPGPATDVYYHLIKTVEVHE